MGSSGLQRCIRADLIGVVREKLGYRLMQLLDWLIEGNRTQPKRILKQCHLD